MPKWAQDAARLGSLIKGTFTEPKPGEEVELKEVLIDNLAWLHIEHYKIQHPSVKSDTEAYDGMRKMIAASYLTHHVSLLYKPLFDAVSSLRP